MSSQVPGRDVSLDRALDRVRQRHRQVQRAKRASNRAKREAQRINAVTTAELLAYDAAETIVNHLGERPRVADWVNAMSAAAAAFPDDRRLHQDFRSIMWTSDPPLTLDEVRESVTRASVAHHTVVMATRTRGTRSRGLNQDGVSASQRARKKLARREADRTFEAALAGISTAVVSTLRGRSTELRTIASGSLLRQ